MLQTLLVALVCWLGWATPPAVQAFGVSQRGDRQRVAFPNGPALSLRGSSFDLPQSFSSENDSGSATVQSPPAPQVENLSSLQDFFNVIDNAPPGSLVAIKYYGKSCALCKRVSLKYKKMPRFYAKAPIEFYEIEKTVHPDLFERLGVTTFPYLQIYRNQQCVASHGTESATRFESIVHDTIQNFLQMPPGHWESFLTAFAGPIDASTARFQSLRTKPEQDEPSASVSDQ